MELKSILLDILKHTNGIGIENIKVVGTEEETTLAAMDPDRTVIMNATLHNPVQEFVGECGMGNLGLLSNIMRLSNYDESSTLSVVRETRAGQEESPTTLVFEDKNGNKDQYRFMSKEIVNELMRIGRFKGANWDITISPTEEKIKQLAEVANIYTSVESTFSARTENNNLVFDVGSPDGGIMGKRQFASNVEGTLDTVWSWNLSIVLNILKLGLTGSSVMMISKQGVCQINIDSGVSGVYTYILPALNK